MKRLCLILPLLLSLPVVAQRASFLGVAVSEPFIHVVEALETPATFERFYRDAGTYGARFTAVEHGKDVLVNIERDVDGIHIYSLTVFYPAMSEPETEAFFAMLMEEYTALYGEPEEGPWSYDWDLPDAVLSLANPDLVELTITPHAVPMADIPPARPLRRPAPVRAAGITPTLLCATVLPLEEENGKRRK